MKPVSFFDKYAAEYDWLTNAAERAVGHGREIDALIERFHPTRVLDAGCATGLTSSLFGERGVEAVGLDRSRQMLKQAELKYSNSGLPISFRGGKFESLPAALNGRFDLVVCLANSIVGVETRQKLIKSLMGFRRVLCPGGYLVLQTLNTSALKDRQVMPVKITQHNSVLYSRFLERSGSRSILYILRADSQSTPPSAELFRHESISFTPVVVERSLRQAGFEGIQKFGGLLLTNRFSAESRDLVLIAQRPPVI